MLKEFNLKGKFKELVGNFSNNISVNLDKTYKVTDYNYSVSGDLKKSKIELFQTIKNNFIKCTNIIYFLLYHASTLYTSYSTHKGEALSFVRVTIKVLRIYI